MPCLSCVSTATTPVYASLADDRPLPSVPPGHASNPRPPTPPSHQTRTGPPPTIKIKNKKTMQKRSRPTITQIERAIGAGVFSDPDATQNLEPRRSVLDVILPTTDRNLESSVERKLRETGEWIASHTERRRASTGKRILMVLFLWVLPTWTFLLLVASGVIKLPFSLPFLNDLIM